MDEINKISRLWQKQIYNAILQKYKRAKTPTEKDNYRSILRDFKYNNEVYRDNLPIVYIYWLFNEKKKFKFPIPDTSSFTYIKIKIDETYTSTSTYRERLELIKLAKENWIEHY